MTDPGVQTLAMLRTCAARGSQGGSYHQWHLELATGHIVNLGRLVHDLVHCQRDEITKHDVDNGAHTGHRSADAQAGNTCFRDGCIDHARGPKFFDQAREYFEWCTGLRYVFAHDKYAWIAAHFFG